MSNMLILIAPSETKNTKNEKSIPEKLSFTFEKPKEIAINVTEKDLKCSGKRFDEALIFNTTNGNSPVLEAIFRYTGVQYNHLDYENLSQTGKIFFDENVLILSGMYGLVRPKDLIGNYKLPIESRGLYEFWGNKIAESLIDLKPNFIINLLPKSYEKVLNLRKNMKILQEKNIVIIHINFIKNNGEKISHNSKIYRGKFLRNICENKGKNFLKENFHKISENIWELNYISE